MTALIVSLLIISNVITKSVLFYKMSDEPKPLGIVVGEGVKAQERIGPPPPVVPKKHDWIPLIYFCGNCNQRSDENPSDECPGK